MPADDSKHGRGGYGGRLGGGGQQAERSLSAGTTNRQIPLVMSHCHSSTRKIPHHYFSNVAAAIPSFIGHLPPHHSLATSHPIIHWPPSTPSFIGHQPPPHSLATRATPHPCCSCLPQVSGHMLQGYTSQYRTTVIKMLQVRRAGAEVYPLLLPGHGWAAPARPYLVAAAAAAGTHLGYCYLHICAVLRALHPSPP